MQPLLMLTLYLIVAIVVIWLVITVLNATRLSEPWRSVVIAVLVLAVVVVMARQLGLL